MSTHKIGDRVKFTPIQRKRYIDTNPTSKDHPVIKACIQDAECYVVAIRAWGEVQIKSKTIPDLDWTVNSTFIELVKQRRVLVKKVV